MHVAGDGGVGREQLLRQEGEPQGKIIRGFGRGAVRDPSLLFGVPAQDLLVAVRRRQLRLVRREVECEETLERCAPGLSRWSVAIAFSRK